MKSHIKKLASIIIVNYNNEKFLKKSLKSVINQSYKFIEIIVVDDNSSDNSLEVLKKFKKKIYLIKNIQKTNYGSFNQLNCYYKGYLKSKGNFIFFLDSDDYFKNNKVKKIINIFENKKDLNIIFDLPIFKFKNEQLKKKFKQKKYLFSSWPRFSPQSCISVKKEYAKELFKHLKIKKYQNIWFDFRIASYSFLKNKTIFILKDYLTYYRQLDNSASKKWKRFSKNWWLRRNEAHEFMTYLSKKLNNKDKYTPDKMITKLVNFFLKKNE